MYFISFIHSFIIKAHSNVYARLRQSSGKKHVYMNKNNKNTRKNFKAQWNALD